MSVDTDRPAPYAPAATVIKLIRQHRDRGLPEPLTPSALGRFGISEGNARRILHALRCLGLIDEQGACTEKFGRLRRASTEEYPDLLSELIKVTYHDIFETVDPVTASDIALNDAFRHHQPLSQRSRMVMLFTGLCREAGILAGTRVERQPATKRAGRPPTRKVVVEQPSKTPLAEHTPPVVSVIPPAVESAGSSLLIGVAAEPANHHLIRGLLGKLPANGRWTKEVRERWMSLCQMVFDSVIVLESEAQPMVHNEIGGLGATSPAEIAGRERTDPNNQ
jgi:hypothetical protein